jgi:hypothetical protein
MWCRYEKYASQIQSAFTSTFSPAAGSVAGGSQTTFGMSLSTGAMTGVDKSTLIENLVRC